ncbi:MAG: hypothetical protein ACLT4X_06095 [Phascolarctobacterium sp.]
MIAKLSLLSPQRVARCGVSADQIACVRRLPNASWTVNARVEAISTRKECF